MTTSADRFNATITGRATARRAGGLQVPVRWDDGRDDLAACLTETCSSRFTAGRRVLIEGDRPLITEMGL